MNRKSSGNPDKLSIALVVAGISLPLTVFLFEATPTLIVTVAPALLAFLTMLLMLLLIVSASVIVYICVKWLWHIAQDDRATRRYKRRMLDLDLQERELEIEEHELAIEERRLEIEERKRRARPFATRTSRVTDASIPAVIQQQRPVPRRLNVQRPDH